VLLLINVTQLVLVTEQMVFALTQINLMVSVVMIQIVAPKQIPA